MKAKKTPSAGATSILFRIRAHTFVVGKLTRPMQRLVDMGFLTTKRRGFFVSNRRTYLELTQAGRDYLSLFDTPPPWQPKQPPARSPRAEKKEPARVRRQLQRED